MRVFLLVDAFDGFGRLVKCMEHGDLLVKIMHQKGDREYLSISRGRYVVRVGHFGILLWRFVSLLRLLVWHFIVCFIFWLLLVATLALAV